MYNTERLNKYTTVADFVAQVCGKAGEVVLYDVISTEGSITVVQNDDVGQKQEDRVDDIVRQMIDDKIYDSCDYVVNYDPDDSGRLISVLFIKEQDQLVGVLCINKDTTAVIRLAADFEAFLEKNNLRLQDKKEEVGEITDRNDIMALLRNIVKSEIERTGIHPMRLTLDEKVQLVHRLKEKGALMISGAITEIAKQLMVSEPSIYRYLSRTE